jgi:hypothetical protein
MGKHGHPYWLLLMEQVIEQVQPMCLVRKGRAMIVEIRGQLNRIRAVRKQKSRLTRRCASTSPPDFYTGRFWTGIPPVIRNFLRGAEDAKKSNLD